jgi:hypothetical protein
VEENIFRVFSEHLEKVVIESKVKLFANSSKVFEFAGGDYLLIECETRLDGIATALLNDELRDSILSDERLNNCWDKIIYNFSSSRNNSDSPTAT